MNLIHHQAFQNFTVRLFNLIQQVDEFETRARTVIQTTVQRIIQLKSQADLSREKMFSAMKRLLQDCNGKWEKLAAELHNLSPLNILKKGYTLCWKNNKPRLVQQIGEVDEGDEMTVSFFKGEFTARVRRVDRHRLIESRFQKK
jgi:exodeoxyribonuclease VII large subunit